MVHHDRLTPVRENVDDHRPSVHRRQVDNRSSEGSSDTDSDSDDNNFRGSVTQSDYEPSTDSASSVELDNNEDQRRYPVRERRQRNVPGAVPWSALPKL